MATYGRVKLGRLTLREDRIVGETSDTTSGRLVNITGQESMGTATGYPLSVITQRREDLLALDGQIVPVLFDRKPNFNGYYQVKSASGTIENHDGLVGMFAWNASLERVGTDLQLDIESRLSGALTRVNDFLVTGSRGHAPAVGHVGYQTGATIPVFTTRAGSEGNVTFYRNLGVLVNPRWACPVANYGLGRVRMIDANGYERSGVDASVTATNWELSNSLVRVRPLLSGGVFEISAYTGGAWRTKNWDVLVNTGPAVSLGVFDYVTIVKNSYEAVIIRLIKSLSPGRVTVDLTMRRGHRFVEIYVQHDFSTTIKIVRSTAEGGTRPGGTAGYVVATANDANTNKYIIGSTRAYDADAVNGGISKVSTATLDAFIGVVAGGTGAVSGDTATDVYAQYIGVPSELVRGVTR